MTISHERLKEVVRDFGRRHIAYHMARELQEIYRNGPIPVWNDASEIKPESNGLYLIQTDYGVAITACYDCDSDEWRGSDGAIVKAAMWMDIPPLPAERKRHA